MCDLFSSFRKKPNKNTHMIHLASKPELNWTTIKKMDPQVIILALTKWSYMRFHNEAVNTGETSWLFKNELGFKEMTHAYMRADYMMKPSQTRCKPGHMLPCSAGWDLLCHAAWQRSRKLETKRKKRLIGKKSTEQTHWVMIIGVKQLQLLCVCVWCVCALEGSGKRGIRKQFDFSGVKLLL